MSEETEVLAALQEYKECCKIVVSNVKDQNAVSYAQVGLALWNKNEIRAQILYILNNCQMWKGELARETKARLKAAYKTLNK